MVIDAVVRGALMGKKCDEAYELLEEMCRIVINGNLIEQHQEDSRGA